MTSPLVFVDTETTSLAPNRRAWEVAMIRVEPDADTLTGRGLSFFISDVDLAHADQQALAVGRFYDRHPRYAEPADRPGVATGSNYDSRLSALARAGTLRTENQAALTVEHMTRGAQLVGFNPGFDAEVLSAMLRHHHLVPAWHYHPIDVKALAAGFLLAQVFAPRIMVGAPPTAHQLEVLGRAVATTETEPVVTPPSVPGPPWSTEALSLAVGVKPPAAADRHTAMGDARWTQRLYNAIVHGREFPVVGGAA